MFGFSNNEKEAKLKANYHSELKELLTNISTIAGRSGLVTTMSGGYDNADTLHNVYCDFGYPDTLQFSNFWNMYRRFGVAAAVVDKPPSLSWLTPPIIEASDRFQKELELLINQTKLWNRLKGLDKRQRVGRYAGLFVEVADNKRPEEPVEMLAGIGSVRNLKPIYEGQLQVSQTNQKLGDENYGQPMMYEFTGLTDGERNENENNSFKIHPSRVIIAAEGADDGSIYGISALENIYNDLLDLRKISGAGGEGFYQNTRSAPVIKAEDGFKTPETTAAQEELEEKIDAFLGKWQKKFVSKGLDFIYPNISLDNPKEFAENSWQNISAGSGISTNELRGVQTGVLAGDKDNKSTMVMIQSRRENFLTELVNDVLDWFIRYGVLENSEYEVVWDDMTASSDTEKLALGEKMAIINEKAFRSGTAPIFAEDEIRLSSGFEPETFAMPSERVTDDDEDETVAENE